MHVDIYEKIWMWSAGGLVVVFLGVLLFAAGSQAIHPPSHIETIDPTTLDDHPEFSRPGVELREDGSAVVTGIAEMFIWDPDPIEVPAGVPVTFRLTSRDVIHGFMVPGTNANAMVIPGYVTEFTVTFDEVGDHLVLCHEYCGRLHHEMLGYLTVLEPEEDES